MQIELSQDTLDFEDFSEFVRFNILISYILVKTDFLPKQITDELRRPKMYPKRSLSLRGRLRASNGTRGYRKQGKQERRRG